LPGAALHRPDDALIAVKDVVAGSQTPSATGCAGAPGKRRRKG
jgi:hypothetical protein